MIIEGTLSTGTPLVDYTKQGVSIKGKYDSGIGGSFQVDKEIFTPDSQRDFLYSKSSIDFFRNAIINGNFDIWQRGITASVSTGSGVYLADRWYDFHHAEGGTLPTLTRTREKITNGEIESALFYARLTTNGAGSSYGANARGQYQQRLENGVRYLCGVGRKVTLTFWARSSIANKRIGCHILQRYGSGGSPSADDSLVGTNWALTSSWQKFTHTFDTATLNGKTFGTNDDDILQPQIYYMWGSSQKGYVGSATNETFVGSGTIDIAQVQLSSGDQEPASL
jgi:hypothetical protein